MPDKRANLASRIQLKQATILLMDSSPQNLEILTQIFIGFGAGKLLSATSYENAQKIVTETEIDLIVCDATLEPGPRDGYDFVTWLRRSEVKQNVYAPVIMITAHTSIRNVTRARDCGSHFVVMKPLTPHTLLERILWIAQVNRMFVDCDVYAGPDRRFHNIGYALGDGRRRTDLPAELGDAVEPNMDQMEIDRMLKSASAA